MTGEAVHPNVCWIASYPRSGNTFFRTVISNVLFGQGEHRTKNRDMPEFVERRAPAFEAARAEARMAPTAGGPVFFAKTHHHTPPALDGVRNVFGLYIYRHPLDVFLSSLNFVYMQAEKKPNNSKYFINAKAKSVEAIVQDGELGHYFDRFLREDGIAIFRPFAGRWSESLVSWRKAVSAAGGNLLFVNYEDVVSRTEHVMHDLLGRMGVGADMASIVQGVGWARAVTRQDGKFFWRARPGAYKELLDQEQIDRYFAKYAPALAEAGVSFPT